MLTVSSNDQKVFSIEREFTSNFMVLFDEFLGLYGNNASETFKATMSAPEVKIKTKNDPFPVAGLHELHRLLQPPITRRGNTPDFLPKD